MSVEKKKRLEDWVIKSLDNHDTKNSFDLMNLRLLSFPTDSFGSFRSDDWKILQFLYLTAESIGELYTLSSLPALSLLLILTHIVHSCAYEMNIDKGISEVRMQNVPPIK
jgi:hypothetical protein